ncbi:MAG: lipoprotein insertase outer membrane protein LolB [Gammaproteobacteria bacterium]
MFFHLRCRGARLLLGACAVSLLSACASLTPVADQPPVVSAATLQNWQVQGRLAAINGNESWPASVRWEQNQQIYAVDLIGPLGQGRISVRGDASSVELSTGQERLQARDPDALLAQATGLQVPISGLKYWIRGIPDPATPARIERNADGRIARLEQNGWRIDYPNWIQEQGIDLPKRIQAVQDALKVNIAITTWTLPQ